MYTPHQIDKARVALARRQHHVVGELLAGRVPAGFDPVGAALTGDILVGKRADAARRVGPQLAELPQWRTWFRLYAHQLQVAGCAHDDVEAFTGWLAARTDLDGCARDWLIAEQVYAGTRRLAWVHHRGRRELLVGTGTRTRIFAISQSREGDKEGSS